MVATFDMRADFVAPVAEGDVGRAVRVLAEDVLFLVPGLRPVQGRALVARVLRRLRHRFGEMRMTCTTSFAAEPGWIVSTWTVEATLARCNRSYRNDLVCLVRLDRQGRIAYLSDYFKSTDFAACVGAGIPAPRNRIVAPEPAGAL